MSYESYDYVEDLPVSLPINTVPSLIDTVVPQEERDRLISLLLADSETDVTVNAAHMYQRKSEMTYDTFGYGRNRSYGGNSDDIVVQVTMRVPSHSSVFNDVKDNIEAPVLRMVAEKQKQEKVEQLAQATATLAKAQAELEAAQAALDATEK